MAIETPNLRYLAGRRVLTLLLYPTEGRRLSWSEIVIYSRTVVDLSIDWARHHH